MKKQIITLFHVSYWGLYLTMLLVVFLVAQIGQFNDQRIPYFICVGFSFVIAPSILGFYLSYIFLFDNYLKHRNFFKLIGNCIIVLLLIIIIACGLIFISFESGFMFKNGYSSFFSEVFFIAVIGFINGVIGFVLKGFISWYENLKIKEQLQKHTQKIELDLIKSKLDPHFLFNSINNIDGMMIKNTELASKYLDKLSSILRFMLYESKVDKIHLGKELEYIQKYIDLQKIRTTNIDFVNYTVEGKESNHMIPPMLFIPYIENAFKHVGTKKSFHAITVKISIHRDKIIFNCKNNFNPNQKKSNENEGLGNELIEKRLQLLYPNRHTITRTIADNIFSIQLTILLHED